MAHRHENVDASDETQVKQADNVSCADSIDAPRGTDVLPRGTGNEYVEESQREYQFHGNVTTQEILSETTGKLKT